MLVSYKKISKITFIKDNVYKICKNYDVVLALGSFNVWDYFTLAFKRRNFKLIYWGIGAPASYTRHYGEASKLYYAICDNMEKRADALLFYDKAAIDLHNIRSSKWQKMFVAPNTTMVLN